MPLSETVIRQTKPDSKPIKLFDGRGLYLLVQSNGAREGLALQEPKLARTTYAKAVWTLETLIFPGLGRRPTPKITAPDLLSVLRKVEVRGTYETTQRAKQRCGQVLRFAIATGRSIHDITADLRGALAPVVATNHAAITDPARVGELRHATWSEFDLDQAEWRIPVSA
jgi:integrase